MNTDLSCSSVFNFNATHNGIQCIQSLKPEDQGTERQIWFSAKMLANFFECSGDTIRRRIEVLVLSGDLNEAQNCVSLNVPNAQGNGSVKTTLYNLTVLNKIAMTFIDCQRAVEIRKAFNDVVIKHETNSINDIIQKAITDPDFAIGILTNLKQEKQLRLQAEAERDEAIRTKACISSKREATLMLAKREDNKKIKALTCENTDLKEQNEILKVSLGESNQWMSSAQLIQNFNLKRVDGKLINTRTLTTMLKKCGCRHRKSDFPDKSGFNYTIFFVEDVKKALNIF